MFQHNSSMSNPQTKNAASADAQVTPTDKSDPTVTTDQKRRPTQEDKFQPSSKKPRFVRSKATRRGGAAYDKTSPVTSLSIVPRLRIFPIFTSNLGCRLLAEQAFNAIRARDFRLAQNITVLQLSYVLTIAFCNRLAQCGIQFGYAFVQNASFLKQIATGIQLPSVLAQYIESIGAVKMASAASVVPYVADYRRLFPPNSDLMVDPADLLFEAGRPIPPGEWALDSEWIIAYNEATTRASRTGMNFRVVDNTSLNGRSELLVSYLDTPDNMILPKAPQTMSEAEAQLGAVYRFRNYNDRAHWFGMHHELLFDAFTAIPCDPTVVFSDICVAAFKGSFISTD